MLKNVEKKKKKGQDWSIIKQLSAALYVSQIVIPPASVAKPMKSAEQGRQAAAMRQDFTKGCLSFIHGDKREIKAH